jgi:hypothetical protein
MKARTRHIQIASERVIDTYISELAAAARLSDYTREAGDGAHAGYAFDALSAPAGGAFVAQAGRSGRSIKARTRGAAAPTRVGQVGARPRARTRQHGGLTPEYIVAA